MRLNSLRMARLIAWLEMRARREPPNSQVFGLPVSSLLRFDGAKFWRMWISSSMRWSFLVVVVFGRVVRSDAGRVFGVVSVAGVVAPEFRRPALLHAVVRAVPIAEVIEQLEVVDGCLGPGVT